LSIARPNALEAFEFSTLYHPSQTTQLIDFGIPATMASKRAFQQLVNARTTSVIGRQTPRASVNVARAFSGATRVQWKSAESRAVLGSVEKGKLNGFIGQKRWHSRAPEDLKDIKKYEYDDVGSLSFNCRANVLICRFYTSSKLHQTRAS
jgi:hypothetical protein